MRSIVPNWLQGALALLLLALTVWGFVVLPLGEPLPIHWDIAGEPDRFAPAPVALLLPVVLVAVVIALFRFIDSRSTSEEREARGHIEATVVPLLIGLAAVIQVIVIMAGLGTPLDIGRTIALAMAVFLIAIGNVLPKSRRNWRAGIRVPPTLADDANWQATHRFGGRLFMTSGLLLGVVALFTGNQVALFLSVLAAAFVPAIAAVAFSYRYASRK